MTQFLLALLGAAVGLVGGYIFGVAQSRSERRDNALAEIFKEMMLFYRGVISWTSPHDTEGPITESGVTWRASCRKQYEVFLNAFFGNAIWLGRDTERMIKEFAEAGKEFLNGVDTSGRRMSDGTSAWDWRAKFLTPKLNEVEDALRAEVELSRSLIPWSLILSALERLEKKPNREDRG